MEERRVIFAGIGLANRPNSQIVEHELDMVRSAERPAAGVPTLMRIRNWLMPSGRPSAADAPVGETSKKFPEPRQPGLESGTGFARGAGD